LILHVTNEMSRQIIEESVETEDIVRKEHTVTIDGVIDIPLNVNPEEFFDGLLDVIIQYVEKHQALAGLGMSHNEYSEELETSDGREAAENG